LRRLIRRAAVKMHQLKGSFLPEDFPEPFRPEIGRFKKTVDQGLKLIDKTETKKIDENFAFDLFQTYGFPFELTQEMVKEKKIKLIPEKFIKLVKQHQLLSRTASAGMFKAGLADHSETVIKYHTATHLLHAALRKVLGEHVRQEGSNITSERLRFDFSHPRALTETEMSQVENLINQKIKENLKVNKTIMAKSSALKSGALAFFKETYPDQVSVYTVGDFSKEICSGPHVDSTGEIGSVKLIKQESIGAGKRRIYAVVNHENKQPAHQV